MCQSELTEFLAELTKFAAELSEFKCTRETVFRPFPMREVTMNRMATPDNNFTATWEVEIEKLGQLKEIPSDQRLIFAALL